VVNNLGTLPRTSASIGWNVPPWVVSDAGPAERTPDLSAIIQEVINRPSGDPANALVMIFAGSGGRREAESFDGNPARAAVLSVQFQVAPVQALNVCVPEALNPNLTDGNGMHHPAPQPAQLQPTARSACRRPSAISPRNAAILPCAIATSPQLAAVQLVVQRPCTEHPLDPTCGNFNPPAGNVGATNVPGDTPVCVIPLDVAGGPSSIAAAMYGQTSECHVEGPATVQVGDEEKTTQAQGIIGLIGKPCPDGQCSVGLAYGFTMDPVTFEVRFHSDPTFEDLASTGASAANAAHIGPAGFGVVGAEETDSSVRGPQR
jgi:hypothetical protein